MERLHHLRAWTPASAGVTVRTLSIALCIPVFNNFAAIKTDAVVHGKRPANDGEWGMATLEVILALFQSGQERKEIYLSHQIATID